MSDATAFLPRPRLRAPGPDLRRRNVAAKAMMRRQRVQWLVEHQGQWRERAQRGGFPRRPLVEAMRRAGLVARSTYWADVKIDSWMDEAVRQMKRRRA